MNKQTDWLNWFKLAVTQARDARLAGNIEKACELDRVIELYYRELEGFSADYLYEIETDIRNNGANQ